ncbi:c-type cytochrome [Burkholderia plantarii]|uniref:c-type cytochrome n=1 Tax=Burkholderia plantarii TaxID=41899 RepID=UPI0018DBF551|nr:cytochrome c [Burkholderia plantarii]MBI0331503.1 cytochrome c [Burkholderia plantarii]
MTAAWLDPLLATLHDGEVALGWLAARLGLAGISHGQPAWPWARRIAIETLAIDPGLARRLGLAWLASIGAVGCALGALVPGRARLPLAAAAVACAWLAPWPPASLWLTAATPTSFQVPPAPFSVVTATHGASLYAQHCLACHGATGRGDGPRAGSLPVWPPTMAGPLLARRLDGELFWHVAAGLRDRDGRATMPGFAGTLGDGDIWDTLAYLRVLSASGGSASGEGWPVPLALPALEVRCADGAPRPLARWRSGQRVYVVALGDDAVPPFEDPRWQTLLLTRDGRPPARVPADGPRATCTAATPEAWPLFATIAARAPDRFAGTALIADRAGWLRAVAAPGTRWSDADLLCGPARGTAAAPIRASRDTNLNLPRASSSIDGSDNAGATATNPNRPRATSNLDAAVGTHDSNGIDALLARIDAEPVIATAGGNTH